jgi:hypothetical protein
MGRKEVFDKVRRFVEEVLGVSGDKASMGSLHQ